MEKWNGIERRRASGDHDSLIEVVQILKNHVSNFDTHVKQDETSFQKLRDQVGKHAIFIYIGLGIIATLKVLIK